jgi:alpha-beta hydrolase superfamily lysophospholipase
MLVLKRRDNISAFFYASYAVALVKFSTMKKLLFGLATLLLLAQSFHAAALRMAPFRMDSVSVAVKGGNIKGVLTTSLIRMSNQDKSPLVIIVPGSGPTDMNGNSMAGVSANSYLMLARDFAERGISSYRYDKRGIGNSNDFGTDESKISFADMVVDVKTIVAHFKKLNQFRKIIILGHSEGSLIGMLAASGADKYISLAGPADNASALMKVQLKGQLGKKEAVVFKQLDSLRKGLTVRDKDPQMQMLFRESVQPYLKSWFKYTPTTEIKKLKIPILIVAGNKDIQVGVDQANKLKKAAPKAKLVIVENMNHVLKTVEDDSREANIETYSSEFLPLVYDFVEKTSEWINAN